MSESERMQSNELIIKYKDNIDIQTKKDIYIYLSKNYSMVGYKFEVYNGEYKKYSVLDYILITQQMYKDKPEFFDYISEMYVRTQILDTTKTNMLEAIGK